MSDDELLMMLGGVTALGAGGPPALPFLLDTLVGYWKLDDTSGSSPLIDSIGPNAFGGPNAGNPVAGIINSGQYIISGGFEASNKPTLQPPADFSFSVWARVDDISNPHVVFSKGDASLTPAWDFLFMSGTGGFQWQVDDAHSVLTPAPPVAGSWHHYIVWYDSVAQIIGIRVDDAATFTAAGVPHNITASMLVLGAASSGGSLFYNWNGVIDELGFWWRLLNAAEKTKLYNNGAGTPLSAFLRSTSPQLLNTLISYWTLDAFPAGQAPDSWGSNLLSVSGAVTSAAGKINNAASFAGGGTLYVTNNASVQVTSDFTLACWVNLNAQVNQGIVGKWGSPAANADYLIGYVGGSGFYFTVANSASSVNTSALFPNIPNGGWHLIVAWYDSTDQKVRLRLDDANTFVAPTGGALTQGTASFTIGSADSGVAPMSGLIDEVGFWKRKLTAAEMTQLYGGGAGFPFKSFR